MGFFTDYYEVFKYGYPEAILIVKARLYKTSTAGQPLFWIELTRWDGDKIVEDMGSFPYEILIPLGEWANNELNHMPFRAA